MPLLEQIIMANVAFSFSFLFFFFLGGRGQNIAGRLHTFLKMKYFPTNSLFFKNKICLKCDGKLCF
jgi:hypothetical protein